MNFGYNDIQNIIYQNAIRMKYPGASKFAKDTAKLIYEMIEEDIALCEFVDVSKNNLQKILREGLDLMKNS